MHMTELTEGIFGFQDTGRGNSDNNNNNNNNNNKTSSDRIMS